MIYLWTSYLVVADWLTLSRSPGWWPKRKGRNSGARNIRSKFHSRDFVHFMQNVGMIGCREIHYRRGVDFPLPGIVRELMNTSWLSSSQKYFEYLSFICLVSWIQLRHSSHIFDHNCHSRLASPLDSTAPVNLSVDPPPVGKRNHNKPIPPNSGY